jgi:hypothetical protein
LRYPSDLSDAEWALAEPLIPAAKRGGRKRTVDVREVLNAIFYVLSTGCQWGAPPKDLPPKIRLLGPVAVGRHTGTGSSYALRRLSRAGRARGEPVGGDHRQSECPSGVKKIL